MLFLDVPTAIAIPLIAPLAAQEMVLAIRFIAKGFDSAALERLVPSTETVSDVSSPESLVHVT